MVWDWLTVNQNVADKKMQLTDQTENNFGNATPSNSINSPVEFCNKICHLKQVNSIWAVALWTKCPKYLEYMM